MEVNNKISRDRSIKTPFGEDDLMEHSMMHAKKHHPEMVNTPKSELKKMIKDA